MCLFNTLTDVKDDVSSTTLVKILKKVINQSFYPH